MTQIALGTGPQDPSQLLASLNSLTQSLNNADVRCATWRCTTPIAAELISIKAAATPANGAATIAGQPVYPCKLAVRIIIGTTTTTAITAGTLTIVGTGAQGQAVTEVVSLIQNATVTVNTVNAFAHVASLTVASYAANGSGTGNTLGVGQSANLGLPLPVGFSNLVVFKENVDAADETVGTVDTVAGTIAPTTAANATHNYDFWYSYNGPI